MPNNLLVYPSSGAAGPPGPPGSGLAVQMAVDLVGPPFSIPLGGPWIVPGLGLSGVAPASGAIVVNFNLRFGTAGGPIIAPGLFYAAYLSINGGPPEEIARYKVGAGGPGSGWEAGTFGGSIVFIVPPGPVSVDLFVEASPGGVIELKSSPIKTSMSLMA